jgi:hypothetical protein
MGNSVLWFGENEKFTQFCWVNLMESTHFEVLEGEVRITLVWIP